MKGQKATSFSLSWREINVLCPIQSKATGKLYRQFSVLSLSTALASLACNSGFVLNK